MSKPYETVSQIMAERDQLRAELAAIKAGKGGAVAWRDHSVNYAKGEKCPATIETLHAAWDRDQELLLDQKNVISKLKETINQLRQKRSAPPASADAVSVPRELLELEWLEGWLRFAAEPIGQECCGRGEQECCGCPDPVYPGLEDVGRAMDERAKELRALLAQSESRRNGNDG